MRKDDSQTGAKTAWRSKVVIRQGDLAVATTDAIVNAANTDLILGAGVAGAIRRQGGPAVQAECDRIGPIELGRAVVTTGGNLKAPHVIHAAGMRLGGRVTEKSLRASTRNSLLRASENRFRSIAFPAIGTGAGGFPIKRCARIMLSEIRFHLAGATSLERVEVVLFDAHGLMEFERELAAMDD